MTSVHGLSVRGRPIFPEAATFAFSHLPTQHSFLPHEDAARPVRSTPKPSGSQVQDCESFLELAVLSNRGFRHSHLDRHSGARPEHALDKCQLTYTLVSAEILPYPRNEADF